ncbi:MAG: hypothetical protein D6798_03890 [Deltaproteobacteria bacterium]|nr:MAG: hypothetical protein D6798_03890 [Deltaproteobacteria bacterium]
MSRIGLTYALGFIALSLLLAPGCGDKAPVDTGGAADGGAADGGGGDGGTDGGDVDWPDNDKDGWTQDVDCDDEVPEVNPGATEICNGKDDDCDPTTDESGWITIGDTSFESLQAAIDVATYDDTVSVCGGIFAEQLVVDHDLNLISELGVTGTVVDGSGTAGSTLVVTGGHVVIQGFSFTGGTGADHESAGDLQGGGVYISNVDTTILSRCDVSGNSADRGGGIYVAEGANVTLQYSTVSGNSAAEGGAIYGNVADITLNSSEVTANTATIRGGGLTGVEADFTMNSGVAHANSAPQGGGAAIDDDSSLRVVGSDWGEGDDDDNVPDDVWTPEASYDGYGDGSTFTCNPAGCS